MATASWLDLVLVVALVTSVAFGFNQGFLRQACLLVSLYISTVLAAQYHQYPTALILTIFPSENGEIARVIGFALLVTILTITVTWLIWTGYRQTKLPDAVILDSLGGAALGGIIGALTISVALELMRYSLGAPWAEGSPIKYYMSMGLNDSSLQQAFSSSLPIVHAALRPWLPEGIPVILTS